VYSLASGGASIAALFMAGYIPGILTGLALMLVGAIFAIRRKYAVSKENTVVDVFLTLIHLFITVLMAYVFIDSNLHWSYLIIFYIWIRSLSSVVYKKAGNIKWELPTVGFIGLAIAIIDLKAISFFMIPLGVMSIVPFFMNRVKVWHLILQALLVLISINLHDGMHWITSGFLLLEIVVLFSLRLKKDEEIYDNFKGTKKYFAAIPSLLLLVVVIGGIIAGIFTATEASAVAVLYALVLAFTYRELNLKTVPVVLINAVRTTSIVLLLVAASIGLSWIMSFENIPQNVSEALLTLSDNKFIILLIINLILLFVGIFMDMTPAVLIFTPIFLPIVTNLGLDPVHFGIIMVLNLSVGLCTPPVGSVLFIGCSVSNISIERVVRPLIPLFIAMITVLMLVTYWPALSLWLPGMLGF
jgi:TRAP-type C4-dicarboxylate transport system permease large subunit